MSKSRKYTIDGKKYIFSFDGNNNLNGISTGAGRNGQYRETPIDPTSSEFSKISTSDEALDALNINKFKKKDVQTSMQIASAEELNQNYNQNLKKRTNEDIDVKTSDSIQSASVATSDREDPRKEAYAGVLAYPLDIDPQQDHFKITKYEYVRTSIQASRPARTKTVTIPKELKSGSGKGAQYNKRRNYGNKQQGSSTKNREVTTNEAGDSVKGMNPKGSVLLPMPKVVDTNGAEWGESKLNIFGLAAASVGSEVFGKLGIGEDQRKEIEKIQKARSTGKTSGLKDLGSALGTSAFSEIAAKAAGITIDQNAFLARSQGKVLNPNAELLFQGPVLRDFNFDFLMIARSRAEGEEIRKIIRFFKLGMAPRFNNSTFLTTPDIFELQYKRGQGPMDMLDTVNRFNPGGLALRTIAVDYAPSGYWSAYQDSQPVALKMSLNFAELRPIYQGDQEKTPATSVGY